MPSRQRHRGQHSNDPKLFSDKFIIVLNQAVHDLSWLMSKGYSDQSSLKLVGDRYRLTERQRKALLRASCTDEARAHRMAVCAAPEDLKDQTVAIDGYNLLITIEAAFSGGIIIACRDACYRDIASVHGTYRRVEETIPALQLIGNTLQTLGVKQAHWYLDKPVSNSGRLRGLMRTIAAEAAFPWEIELVNNPDKNLAQTEHEMVISSDGWVIDQCSSFFNLHRYIVDRIPNANIIGLSGNESSV